MFPGKSSFSDGANYFYQVTYTSPTVYILLFINKDFSFSLSRFGEVKRSPAINLKISLGTC